MSELVNKPEFTHVSGIPGTPMNQRLFRQIEHLGKSKNLTAAIIHLNDTYLIDERRFGAELAIPGMARVASLVATVRRAVHELCGEDRTIVVHSGDFLSPSLLGKTLKGEAMTDILGKLPLSYATLLVNAGGFRADMFISPIITHASLEEVFLYDNPKAVITFPVTGTELDALLKHSDSQSGNGRVLQRTANAAALSSLPGPHKLAVVAFLLCDESDFDGYAGVLASARGIPVDKLREEMANCKNLTGQSIISLLRESANAESYCRDVRFSLRLESPEEQDVSHALKLIKAYRAACSATGLELRFWLPVLYPIGNSPAAFAPDPLPAPVIERRQELYDWVKKKLAENGKEYLFDVREKLRAHPESMRTNEPYHSYLYGVVMQFLMTELLK